MGLRRSAAKLTAIVAVFTALGVFAPSASGVQVVKNEDVELNIGGLVQMYGFIEQMRDPYSNMPRLYLFQKINRMRISGSYQKVGFDLQLALGGEETVKNLNTALSLLDYSADIPLSSDLKIKVGQFKVPYSRERMADSADLNYADRSINTLAFNVGRDVGFALHGKKGNITGAVGLFTGGGIDVPIRNLPQKIGIPLLSLRAGINKNLDKDIFGFNRVDFNAQDCRYAAYINAIYTKDSKVGHSSALGYKVNDKSLLVNSNWNPYKTNDGVLQQAGADFSLQTPLGGSRLLVDAEINTGTYSSSLGSLNVSGGLVSGNIFFSPAVGIGLRYSVIIPDKNFAYTSTKLLKDNTPIQEITPALTFNLKRNIRIIFDAPIGIDIPVVQEKNNGTYNLMFQPDQASYVTSEGITRETTLAGRMILQFMF